MSEYEPPRGMRDFYPEDYRTRAAIFAAWRTASKRHGFEFFDASIVEKMELLERKAGEEIAAQIYAFQDKSGRRIALRPELTPSLARMILKRQRSLALPLKWTAIAQCFRYERMMRGRKREHYQWNLDIVGESSVMAEVEIIATAITALRALGLSSADFTVYMGSRSVLGELLVDGGLDPTHLAACFLAIDRRAKVGDAEICRLLTELGLSNREVDQVLNVAALRTLDEVASRIGNSEAVRELREFFALTARMGIADYVTLDLSIVRGLDYYTGIVFEAFDVDRRLRAIFGGGRYDNLLSTLGGERMPCVGLGFGDVVLMALLTERGKAIVAPAEIGHAVGYMDAASRRLAITVASALRDRGQDCDLALRPEKAKAFFKRANRIGARHAVYVGPDEVASGRFGVKEMATGDVTEMTLGCI